VAEKVGPAADEFFLKVQKATAGPPWFKNTSTLVCFFICASVLSLC